MSGKSTATSSIGIGCAVLEPDAAAARHAGADPAVAGVEEHRQPRLGEHLVERVGQAVVGDELLQRRVELEPADAAASDEPPRLAYRLLSRVRVQADEGKRDVGVSSREVEDRLVSTCGRPVSCSSTANTTQAMRRLR